MTISSMPSWLGGRAMTSSGRFFRTISVATLFGRCSSSFPSHHRTSIRWCGRESCLGGLNGASATFFRPVTAATHVLDTRLFGDAFWGHHLHSFVWAGLGVWVVAGLYRRLSLTPWLQVWPFWPFHGRGTHHGHRMARQSQMHGSPLCSGCWAMRLHLSSRLGASALASVSFGLALGAGEMGLCAGAYLLSWEVWMGQGGLRSRIRRLLPYAGVFLVWVLMYTKGAFGVIGSGLYVDPIQATGPFLEQLPGKFSVLLASQAFQVPPEIWMLLPSGGDAWLAAGSLLALGLTVWAMLPWFLADRNRLFWATGLVLCLLPGLQRISNATSFDVRGTRFLSPFGRGRLFRPWMVKRARRGAAFPTQRFCAVALASYSNGGCSFFHWKPS